MKPRFRIRVIDGIVVAAIIGYCGYRAANRAPQPAVETSTFADQVQLGPLARAAVHADGRLRSFESHAKTYMGYICGPRSIHRRSKGFTYLDLMFRPERYFDVDLIYIKSKNVRARILDTLRDHPGVDADRIAGILKSGLIARTLLAQPEVVALLDRMGQDLIRTAKFVDAIQSALAVSDADFLLAHLRLVPPPGGETDQPWLSLSEVVGLGVPRDDVHAGVPSAVPIPGMDPGAQRELSESWTALRRAWRAEDAATVNTQLTKLADLFPKVAPQLYPSQGRLAMESWYFRNQSMTWVWLIYLAAVIPLLMSVIYPWDGARKVGMVLFVVAFGFHTATLGVRWYISGRWPNSNMFEALTTAAWFGGVATLILERITRRTPFRSLFALGSSVVSMAALMAVYFLPAQLDSAISNKMAALNDVWLYIHTNMIISSYAVIGLACVPAILQLRHRWCLAWDQQSIPRLRLVLLPVAVAVLNYTAYRLLMHLIDNTHRGLTGAAAVGVTGAFWGSLMIVLLEGFSARARRQAGARVERSASGGASSLMAAGPSASSFLKEERPTATQIFDGATMVLVELSFIMLWTGLVMGAIWADHSWGRPWGWDPKEVFALNTFIIFLVLIHVRLKVRDKSFWTAVLAVAGFQVMMFNWIVVNFIISGLHSYA